MYRTLTGFCLVLSFIIITSFAITDDVFIDYEINKPNNSLIMVWKDSTNKPFNDFNNLNAFLRRQGKELKFCMNGGMYTKESTPLGLYIEKGKTLTSIDTTTK